MPYVALYALASYKRHTGIISSRRLYPMQGANQNKPTVILFTMMLGYVI